MRIKTILDPRMGVNAPYDPNGVQAAERPTKPSAGISRIATRASP